MLYTRDGEKQEEGATTQPDTPSDEKSSAKEVTTSSAGTAQDPLKDLGENTTTCFQVNCSTSNIWVL